MGQKVLWVHGWGTSADVWREGCSLLPGYDHHFVSFAGCRTADDFRNAIVRKLYEGSGGWVVIGWSMGGMLALEAVRDVLRSTAGNAVDKLILLSATLRFTADDRAVGWPSRVLRRMQKRLQTHPQDTLQQFREAMFTDAEKKQLHSDPWLNRQWTDFTPEGLQAGLDYLITADLSGCWNELLADPCLRMLWLHGEQDSVCPPGCIPGRMSPRVQMRLFPKAGHALMLTDRLHVYACVKKFLDGNDIDAN